MFYSHQLLARKAPLGQIWMAATLHAKINRKRLDKLDIIKICVEILNPPVPMALGLSGILMGGVVILYERKVKLLYDDVSRLPVEINEAWRIRPAVDPTVLPKGKAQAKYEAVTLPENMMDMELFSDVDTPKFWGMHLEDLDDQYVNVNLDDDDDFSCADHHNQAEAVNITLVDNFESGLAETDVFNHFKRFDIADDGTTVNITPDEHPQVPSTLVPSPPRQEDPPQQQQHCGAPSPTQAEPQQGESLQEQEEQKVKGQPTKPSKRKARGKGPQVIMDNQIMIPGNIYQTWLKDPSSLVSRRRRVSSRINLIWAIKINDLMDLPPVALMSYLDKLPLELYCPKQLMQLWKECAEAKSPKASSSGGKLLSSQEQQPRNSPPQEFPPQPQGEYQSEMGAQPMDFTDGVEKKSEETSVEFERAYDALQGDHSLTPGSPGLSHRSASSSGGSGRGFMPLKSEIQVPSGSGRSKRSGGSLGNLDPVEEDFKLRRLSAPAWRISVHISKWMVMIIALLALGGVQASASNAGTCDAAASAYKLVSDCSDYLDNPTQDCCQSLFVTLAQDGCICQVKSQAFYLMSHLADGDQLEDLLRRCGASPRLYPTIHNCESIPEIPPRPALARASPRLRGTVFTKTVFRGGCHSELACRGSSPAGSWGGDFLVD